MKKISLMNFVKILFSIIIFFAIANVMEVSAATRPSQITVGNKILLTDYFGYDFDFNHKQATDGTVIYCLEYPKYPPETNTVMNYSHEADAGLTYIIQNGYPNKKITGDNKKDYFITQIAIWLHLGYTKDELASIKNDMLTKNTTMHKALKNLVDGAQNAKNIGYQTPSIKLSASSNEMTLSEDGKYYVSQVISVKGVGTTANSKITLKNPPKGSELVQSGNGFIVKIPVSSITSLNTTINLIATATGTVTKTYVYKANNNNYQKMLYSVLYPITSSLSTSGKLVIKKDNVLINKTDSETNKLIAGATLVVKDEKGNVVERFETSTKTYTLTNLKKGTYTIQEEKAPNGYEKTDKIYTFTVTNTGKEQTINVLNSKIKYDKVLINKTDSETNKLIAGATLVVKDEKGNVVERFETSAKAYVLTNLKKGTYTIQEEKAPNGYEKTDKVYTFTITNTGKEHEINVPNVQLVHTAQVEISKQDITTSKELPGAKLTIKDKKGNVVESWISLDEPHYLTLEVGTYTLIEEIAPKGYVLSKEEIKFEIKKDTKETVKVVMYNTPEKEEPKEEIVVEVPKTDVNSTVFYTLTASISALGYGLMKKFGKR